MSNSRVKGDRIPASEVARNYGPGAKLVQADIDPETGDLVVVIHSDEFPEWDPASGPVPGTERESEPEPEAESEEAPPTEETSEPQTAGTPRPGPATPRV